MVAVPDPGPLREFLSGTLTILLARARARAEPCVTAQTISHLVTGLWLLEAGRQIPALSTLRSQLHRAACSLVRTEPPAGQGAGEGSHGRPAAGRTGTSAHVGCTPSLRHGLQERQAAARVHSHRERCTWTWAWHPPRTLARSWTWMGSRGSGGSPCTFHVSLDLGHGRLSANRTTLFYGSGFLDLWVVPPARPPPHPPCRLLPRVSWVSGSFSL